MLETFTEIFLNVLGEPTERSILDDYLRFCLDHTIKEDTGEYTEAHHILPRKIFPDYSDQIENPWNIARMTLPDHIMSHELLYLAYPIPSFVYPTHLLRAEDREVYLRDYGDRMWRYMLEHPSSFASWKEKRSEHMKALWKDEEYRSKMSKMASILGSEPKICLKRSEKVKAYWSQENRLNKSRQMKMYFEDGQRRQEISTRFKEKYKDEEYKKKHAETMKIVNSSPEKRQRASSTIREMFKDPEVQKKHRESLKGLVVWNNGSRNAKSRECPGPGWTRGYKK